MRIVAALLAVLCGLILAGGWLGALHPMGDSLAVFRREAMVLFALAVIWTGWPRVLRWGLAGSAMLWLGGFAWESRPQAAAQAPATVTLYQQNLLFSRNEDAAWLAAVAAAQPDVLTLQEVGARNYAMLAPLRAAYPHAVYCPLEPMGELVLSRLPMLQGRCSGRDGFAAMQVQTPSGPVWVMSLHLSWPWPHRQARQVDQILPDMAGIDGRIVAAGDFNAVAWSHTVSRISDRLEARRVGPLVHTFDLPGGLPIGIDHVLATGQGRVIRQPGLGSDHSGLLAQIWFD